jgi:hypothetical protein
MMARYIRAFFKALHLTLAGETIAPPARYPTLDAWAARTVTLVDETLIAADSAGFGAAQRSEFRITLDKRAVTLESGLQTIRHHAAREYPYLLKNFTPYSLMTLQATNLNDRYTMLRFADETALPAPLRDSLARLRDHLDALPSVQDSAPPSS